MRISDWSSDVCSSDLQTVQDDIGNSSKIGFLGVELPQAFERSPNLAAALTKGVNDGIFSIYVQYTTLHQIVTGQRKIMELSGPIRMAKMSAHTLSLGLLPFLYLMALISIAVGIMNLLRSAEHTSELQS